MKAFISILVIIIVLGGGYWLWQQAGSEDRASDTTQEQMIDDSATDDAMMDDSKDGASIGQVVPGETAVDMVVDEDGVKVIQLNGGMFFYDVEEIRVNEGDRVRINFKSIDGFHDVVIDEFNAATEKVQTGEETSVEFVADKAGMYEYYCSVGQHRAMGMVGKLIVQENN